MVLFYIELNFEVEMHMNYRIVFAALVIMVFASSLIAETLYVDGLIGDDSRPGTKDKPLKTIGKAAAMVNASDATGPTTIKIGFGIYNLTKAVVFENDRAYTDKNRLIIEAAVLPDDAKWRPGLMPVIFSTENRHDPEKPDQISGSYGVRIKVSHVTIRGLKFLGSAVPNNMYAPIERIGSDLEDLLVTQCMFIGDDDSFDIYCPVIATGDKLVVDHCIFHGCHASVVFWDGVEGGSYKNNAMRFCIVDGGRQSGVWTCQTVEDFEFHHNVVIDTEFFWLRKRIESPKKYKMRDCVVNVKNYSGYGVATGPTGQTKPEVTYDETGIIKDKPVLLVRDKKAKYHLHVVPGTLGSDLGAGLFKKKRKDK
jgi:hypothetical protein